MLRYIGKRLLMLIPTMLGIALVVLIIIDLTPGDPARVLLGTNATEEQVEELREELGLNKPFLVRYWDFIKNVCHGDFGTSIMTQRPVLSDMLMRFRYTLTLVIFGTVFSTLLGIPIGIYVEGQPGHLSVADLRVHAQLLVRAVDDTVFRRQAPVAADLGH